MIYLDLVYFRYHKLLKIGLGRTTLEVGFYSSNFLDVIFSKNEKDKL